MRRHFAWAKIAPWITLTAVLGACGMFAVKEQQQKLDAFCRFGGQVAGERSGLAAFVVVLARRSGDSWQIADHFVREGPGPWQLVASAGTYGVVAFQDLNRDLKLQPDEPYLALDERRQFECKAGEQYTDLALRIPAAGRARFAGTLDISALQVRSFSDQLNLSVGQVTAVGEVVSLSDPRFDEKVAEDGLWRPFDFLFKGRPGIYFLEPYDAKKLPVLFVHGINGTPANFRPLIEHLDRQRFQPWVYYYPSGARLPNVADHLAQTMRKLQRQYGFQSVAVVAHSMGGLVSRGFLLRYHESGDATVPLFVSIATPWDGHAGAAVGVKTAPAVVRVWVDMAPGSEYLQSLYAADPGVPHYLLFTYRQGGVSLGEASDGTVTVASQLRMAAQQGAARVEGYNETHMSVLESQAVSQRLNELLAHVAQRQ